MVSSSIKHHLKNLPTPIGVLGFGVEGKSTFNLLRKQGLHNIVIFDEKPLRLEDHSIDNTDDSIELFTGSNCWDNLGKVNTLFRSPGFRSDNQELKSFITRGGLLTSQMEFFFEIIPKDKIITVTGTLGKGTCCSMIYNVLQESNVKSILLGNIGIPVLDGLEKIDEETWVILEASSFQLSTLKKSPHVSIVLKTTIEHLDWHKDQEEYWNHKSNLVKYQSDEDILIFNSDSSGSKWIADKKRGTKISFGANGEAIIDFKGLRYNNFHINLKNCKVHGNFNLENMAAAAIATDVIGIDQKIIIQGIENFTGLEHRMEFVGKNDNYSFYNDSYATRPDATIGALKNFSDQPLGLFLGGSDKGVHFEELTNSISAFKNIKAIVLMGETAPALLSLLNKLTDPPPLLTMKGNSFSEATHFIFQNMEYGVILLSPACASFGLFENYKERGAQFKIWCREVLSS